MKKIILLGILIFIGCTSYCQQDSINLCDNTVSLEDGTMYMKYGTSDVLLYNSSTDVYTSLLPVNFTMTTASIQNLSNIANGYASSVAKGVGYVTVLEIKFGITATDSLDLYVRPLCLEKTNGTGGNCYYYNDVLNPGGEQTSSYYRLYPSGQTVMDVGGRNIVDSKKYRDSVTIYHYLNDPVDTFNSYPSDPLEVVYSFQELKAIINANPPCTFLSLVSIGNPVPVRLPNGRCPIIRHDLLIVPPTLPPTHSNNPSIGAFPSKEYADLGNLCPPECPNYAQGCMFVIVPGQVTKNK